MQAMTNGDLAGTGSFRCEGCGYVVTLLAGDELPRCPECSGTGFARASLFGGARFDRTVEPPTREMTAIVADARAAITEAGEYLVFTEGGETQTVPLGGDWTRIGRSLAADIRFDDPTVSRRHALLVRQADGVRVLDDRSLNGVFVNGDRVEWRTLTDGDEIIVGRYHLRFVTVTAEDLALTGRRTDAAAG